MTALPHIRAAALVGVLAASIPGYAAAKYVPVFFSWGGETVTKIADFPDTPTFQNDGDYFDAGAIYKQIQVFFLPLWNYDVRWAGYINESTYIPYPHEELKTLANLAGVALPAKPSLSFWESYGGKIVLFVIAVFGMIVLLAKGSDDAVDDPE